MTMPSGCRNGWTLKIFDIKRIINGLKLDKASGVFFDHQQMNQIKSVSTTKMNLNLALSILLLCTIWLCSNNIATLELPLLPISFLRTEKSNSVQSRLTCRNLASYI